VEDRVKVDEPAIPWWRLPVGLHRSQSSRQTA
jgi:hypothetical protein